MKMLRTQSAPRNVPASTVANRSGLGSAKSSPLKSIGELNKVGFSMIVGE